MENTQISFSFLVITYNHEPYIIDHLESIKYQIETYGKGGVIEILINDDCSNDRTVELIEKWFNINKALFNRVVVKTNNINKGTCSSVINLISLIETKLFKLTAGDDIYSYENIFDASIADDTTAFISGFPLYIENNVLKEYQFSNILTIATKVVYFKKGIFNQFVKFSFNNAPNMFYNLNCAKDKRVIEFVQKFDVTEDWPIQLAISRYYPKYKVNYLNKVLVYYRRTAGSTYIVANNRFVIDRLKIFKELIQNSTNFINRVRLKSRLLAFKTSNKFISRIINIDLYIFFLESLLQSRSIYSQFYKLYLNKNKHKCHLDKIVSKACDFKKQYIKTLS